MNAQVKLDPRAYTTTKLEPPSPLPHVSRRALKRVKNPMPVPTICRYCDSEVRLVNNHQIYGRSYGEWPYAYRCTNRDCDAYIGLHPHTDIPLGVMADKRLRKARKHNKQIFHDLMRASGIDRSTAYRWLACKMQIPMDCCHWGWFDVEQCRLAGDICRRELDRMTQ